MPSPLPDHATDQARFQTSKRTLAIDRLMTVVIKFGGALVITSVLGIFLFILLQIWPLFAPASVEPLKVSAVPVVSCRLALR